MSAPEVVAPRAELAAEINAEHERAFGKAREALEHARRAGELLLQAKAAVGHGEWLPWLAANVAFSERTARGYMRLANHWNELQAKTATVADLGLGDALGLLAEPKAERVDDVDTYTPTPDEAALLAKAHAAGGVDTIEEQRILIILQRRRMQCALVNLEAAAAAGVSHLSPDELRHALECCEDCARMCETLSSNKQHDRDLVSFIYARELSNTLKPLTAHSPRAGRGRSMTADPDRDVTHRAKCYIIVCAACHLLAHTSRSDAITCSTACRVRAHRSGAAQRVRTMALSARVSPGLIVRCQAILLLRPDLGERCRSGELEIDDAETRQEMARSFWELALRSVGIDRPEGIGQHSRAPNHARAGR